MKGTHTKDYATSLDDQSEWFFKHIQDVQVAIESLIDLEEDFHFDPHNEDFVLLILHNSLSWPPVERMENGNRQWDAWDWGGCYGCSSKWQY